MFPGGAPAAPAEHGAPWERLGPTICKMVGGVSMNGKNLILSVLVLAVGCLVATSTLMPSFALARQGEDIDGGLEG